MIHWREQMTVDGGVIDQDHRHLIEIINQFEKFADDGLDREEGMEILYALKFYASTHFKREERLQRRVDYPHYEAHKKEHQALAGQLDMLIDKVAADADRPNDELAVETSVLLQHWLIDHVLHSDMKLRDYVDEMGGESLELEPLASILP